MRYFVIIFTSLIATALVAMFLGKAILPNLTQEQKEWCKRNCEEVFYDPTHVGLDGDIRTIHKSNCPVGKAESSWRIVFCVIVSVITLFVVANITDKLLDKLNIKAFRE